MLSKLRVLAILFVAGALPLAQAHAQNENDDDQGMSIPQRVEQFGRSLVGNNRSSNRPQNGRPQQRNAQQQQRRVARPTETYESYEDDGVAPVARSNGQQNTQRNVPAGQAASKRRVVDDSATAHAPPLGQAARRPQPQPQPNAETDAPVGNAVPRVARAVNPALDDAAIAPPAAEPAAVDTTVRGASPSISVETIGPRKISIGKQSTYKLVLKNTGAVAAREVVVTIAVPEFAEVVEAKGTTGSTEPAPGHDGLCWKLNTLAAQGKEELSLDIVPRKSQPFDLSVRWTQAPVASQTTVEVQEPKLALNIDGAKEVAFGERSTYKLHLSNPGTGDAENVVITLMPLNPGDGPPASHPLGVLRAGESKTIEIELIARQAGQVSIHAEAKAAGDISVILEEEVTVRRAALTVTAKGPKMQYSGTPATFDILVKNTGNAPAQNLKISCRLPLGAEYLSSSSSGHHSEESKTVNWTVGSLEADGEVTLSMKCTLKSPGSNQVEVQCVADRDVQQSAVAKTHVESVADLTLEVVDPSGPVAVGTDMTYEVHIRNRGSKSAESIDVTAYFSNGIEPISVEGGPHELKPGIVVLKTIGSLEMGREVVYKIKAKAETPGTHRFRAELNCPSLDTKLTEEETTHFYDAPAGDAE
ncbi:MAG TPA: hypothetical protein VGN12_00320 [Pirellulales bacterium]